MTTDEHDYSLATARAAARAEDLDRWVSDFLASPGSDNADLAELLEQEGLVWGGPVQLPLDELHRLAGPEDAPTLVAVDEDEWRDSVYDMRDKVEEGWEPPPVVVVYEPPQLVLKDGNHRVESLRQAGETEAWAVVGFADDAARVAFLDEHAAAEPAG
ncbi:MAG: hypothetical protein R8F63_04020 [Acidimicrobiales bacterium]|nr:hypothetical protein [Acidimicrobiales bacterium]